MLKIELLPNTYSDEFCPNRMVLSGAFFNVWKNTQICINVQQTERIWEARRSCIWSASEGSIRTEFQVYIRQSVYAQTATCELRDWNLITLSGGHGTSGAQRNVQLSSGIHLSCRDTGSWYSCRYPWALPFHTPDGAAEGLPLSDLVSNRGAAACGTQMAPRTNV